MRSIVVGVLFLGCIASCGGALAAAYRAHQSFYPWFWPLFEEGVLPAGKRGPALVTWRRLLGKAPEPEARLERLRLVTRTWAFRCLAFAFAFVVCLESASILA